MAGWMPPNRDQCFENQGARKSESRPTLLWKRKKYKMDLIPPRLIVARYFASEQAEH